MWGCGRAARSSAELGAEPRAAATGTIVCVFVSPGMCRSNPVWGGRRVGGCFLGVRAFIWAPSSTQITLSVLLQCELRGGGPRSAASSRGRRAADDEEESLDSCFSKCFTCQMLNIQRTMQHVASQTFIKLHKLLTVYGTNNKSSSFAEFPFSISR